MIYNSVFNADEIEYSRDRVVEVILLSVTGSSGPLPRVTLASLLVLIPRHDRGRAEE